MGPTYLIQRRDVLRRKRLSDGCLQARVSALLWCINHGKPGFIIVAMSYQADRLKIIRIDQQDDHLTITMVGAVVRAGTFRMGNAGHLQIECA